MSYSESDDVTTLLSQLNFDSEPEIAGYITAADEEIDAVIGFRYVTPISVPDSGATRATNLILKKISTWLAAGTAITSVTAASEMQEINDYGRELLRQAREALRAIAAGEVILVGAVEPDGDSVVTRGPAAYNPDGDESQVDAFYAGFGNPAKIVSSGFSSASMPTRRWYPW